MKVWVCIPVYNRVMFTMRCLSTLARQTYLNYQIVVCDHGSTDNTSQLIIERHPEVILLQESEDLWWTGAMNRCVNYVLENADIERDSVLTLNNDLEVDQDYIAALVETALQYPRSIVASAGYDIKTRSLVESGARQNWLTSKPTVLDPERDYLNEDRSVAEVTHASGRGTLIPVCVFDEIGCYDEERLPHYGADYDFTFRASREGYRILIAYSARIYSHVEETGMTTVRGDFGISGFKRYLTDTKSPANLSVRWWLAINNCPRILLPSYLLLDMFFIVGSYFKFHYTNNNRDL